MKGSTTTLGSLGAPFNSIAALLVYGALRFPIVIEPYLTQILLARKTSSLVFAVCNILPVGADKFF